MWGGHDKFSKEWPIRKRNLDNFQKIVFYFQKNFHRQSFKKTSVQRNKMGILLNYNKITNRFLYFHRNGETEDTSVIEKLI